MSRKITVPIPLLIAIIVWGAAMSFKSFLPADSENQSAEEKKADLIEIILTKIRFERAALLSAKYQVEISLVDSLIYHFNILHNPLYRYPPEESYRALKDLLSEPGPLTTYSDWINSLAIKYDLNQEIVGGILFDYHLLESYADQQYAP